MLVATVRALKYHGGVPKAELSKPDAGAVRRGAANLARHIDNLKNGFGLPVCVAINAFPTDTEEEYAVIRAACAEAGVPCELSEVFAKGGEGGKALARTVLGMIEAETAVPPIQFTYSLDAPLADKIEAVAKKIYHAGRVSYAAPAKKMLDQLEAMGYGKLPVCIAKTQYSFSDDASPARRAGRFPAQRARSAPVCRRGASSVVHLRRDHDDARPAQAPGPPWTSTATRKAASRAFSDSKVRENTKRTIYNMYTKAPPRPGRRFYQYVAASIRKGAGAYSTSTNAALAGGTVTMPCAWLGAPFKVYSALPSLPSYRNLVSRAAGFTMTSTRWLPAVRR